MCQQLCPLLLSAQALPSPPCPRQKSWPVSPARTREGSGHGLRHPLPQAATSTLTSLFLEMPLSLDTSRAAPGWAAKPGTTQPAAGTRPGGPGALAPQPPGACSTVTPPLSQADLEGAFQLATLPRSRGSSEDGRARGSVGSLGVTAGRGHRPGSQSPAGPLPAPDRWKALSEVRPHLSEHEPSLPNRSRG